MTKPPRKAPPHNQPISDTRTHKRNPVFTLISILFKLFMALLLVGALLLITPSHYYADYIPDSLVTKLDGYLYDEPSLSNQSTKHPDNQPDSVVAQLIYQTRMQVDSLITTLKNSARYTELMQQEPPTANSLPNPIANAHLTDTWGAARSNGRTHEGIDIFAERDTPIMSTTPGIVRKVGTNQLGGNVVSIIGPGGVGHYYAHLERFAEIGVGDWVETGDVIGYVGDSGNAKGTPPHLHYGIYTKEGAVNPYPLLQK